jgi:hypothetical protein
LLSGVADKVIVNDSGEPVPFSLAGWEHVDHPQRQGLAKTVQSAWAAARDREWSHLFHLEEDFVLRAPVDAEQLADVLDDRLPLSQIVLKRQAWSEEERAAGGIVEMRPDAYIEQPPVTVHQQFFSLNPCVVPWRVFAQGWPDGNEAAQTERMMRLGMWSSFWGTKFAAPVVEHIGWNRSKGWKL